MNCKELLSTYFKALSDGSSCQQLPNGRLSVVLPFVYPDHDNLEVFVKDKGDTIVVSDLGETLRRLDTIGMDFQSSGMLAFQVDRITSGFEVSIQDGVIFKEGAPDAAGALMFDVLSACMAIGDLAYYSRGYRPLTFHDEVSKLLQVIGLKFEKGYEATGRSTTRYAVDFAVKTSHRVSLIQAMGARTQSGIEKWVNRTYRMWSDVRTKDEAVVRKVSLLNDELAHIRKEDITLLEDVSTVFFWTDPSRFIASLRNGDTVA